MRVPVVLTPKEIVNWLRTRGVQRLQVDSRKIQPGDAFIAWPGAAVDGRCFVQEALTRGALACVVELNASEDFALPWETGDVVALEELKRHCGAIAAEWSGHPSRHLPVLTWTGTNGKTSSVWWMAHAMAHLGVSKNCGMIGTLGVGIPGALDYTGLTTPDPFVLQQTLAQLARQGSAACAIEASSIGIVEGRLDGLHIDVAVLTNFTQDHLDYHGSMEAYAEAKRALFSWPQLRCAVINIDDGLGRDIAQDLQTKIDIWTLSTQSSSARLYAHTIAFSDQGVRCELVEAKGERATLSAPVLGHFNLLNVLGVIAVLRTQGVSLSEAVKACQRLAPVPGRLQCEVHSGKPMAVVDYAHTPDAVEQVLRALRPIAEQRKGALWCVLGCGGDRDPVKRPLMARAGQQFADRLMLTSDNPRTERPEDILDAMERGVVLPTSTYWREIDRALAIRQTLLQAKPEDVVLIAGKGHENYQEVNGIRHPFSDLEQARQALAQRKVMQ